MFNTPPIRNLFALCLLAASLARSQELPAPPDYADSAIAVAGEDAMKAWAAWQRGERDMERDVFKAPMSEARDRIQRSLSGFLAYSALRKAYTEKVAAYIENYRPETAARKPQVSIDAVNRDQLELLGVSLSSLQKRLDELRESPEWVRVRRAIQNDRAEIVSLQNARRGEIPVDLPLSRTEAPRPLSAIVYRDSERQVRELTERIWTHYYQALVDAAEQRTGVGKPLLISATQPPGSVEAAVQDAPAAPATALETLAGTWRYVERSQQFNGAGEPTQVLLELWVDKGLLAGRYRATLAGFDGAKTVDVHLQQVPGTKDVRELRFRYETADQQSSGQMSLESPGANGGELMVLHMASGDLPKGREILVRR